MGEGADCCPVDIKGRQGVVRADTISDQTIGAREQSRCAAIAPIGPGNARAMAFSMQLPSFVWALLIFWWSSTVATFTYAIKWLHLTGGRNDAFTWCAAGPHPRARPLPRAVGRCSRVADRLRRAEYLVRFFGVRVLKLGSRAPHLGKCIYLVSAHWLAAAVQAGGSAVRLHTQRLKH